MRKIIVVMDHIAKDGGAKFRKHCALPLTGTNVVDMLITDMAVFERSDRSVPFRLIECAPGITPDRVRGLTEAAYEDAVGT